MHRIDTSTATPDHKFTEGNPLTGVARHRRRWQGQIVRPVKCSLAGNGFGLVERLRHDDANIGIRQMLVGIPKPNVNRGRRNHHDRRGVVGHGRCVPRAADGRGDPQGIRHLARTGKPANGLGLPVAAILGTCEAPPSLTVTRGY